MHVLDMFNAGTMQNCGMCDLNAQLDKLNYAPIRRMRVIVGILAHIWPAGKTIYLCAECAAEVKESGDGRVMLTPTESDN